MNTEKSALLRLSFIIAGEASLAIPGSPNGPYLVDPSVT